MARKILTFDVKLVIASLEDGLRIMKLRRPEAIFLESDEKSLKIAGREYVFIWGVVKGIFK